MVESRETAGEIEVRVLRPAEVRLVDADGKRRIVGYAAVYDSWSPDYGGFREIIRPGAFSGAFGPGADVLGLFNHDANLVLGRTSSRTMSLVNDPKGLLYQIDPPEARADVVESISRGDVKGSSFGFRTLADRWTYEDDGTAERELLSVELFDVGPVSAPYYPQTSVALRALDWHRKTDSRVGLSGVSRTSTNLSRKLSMAARLRLAHDRYG